jgi:hypothetical protein
MRPSTRYEIKYRISREHAEAVRVWIARHMEPDAFGEGGAARYHVHSLYLDNADWRIYRETRNGTKTRFKLRARIYDFEGVSPAFLEVKARDGEAMTKTRAVVSRADARAVLSGQLPSCPDSAALRNFRDHTDRVRAYPRVWVTYVRSAWVGGDRGLVRVTFDSDIACAPPTEGLVAPTRWHLLPEVRDKVVLELKYTGSYPRWLAETIRTFDLERRAMSKYRQAVEHLGALAGGRSAS